MSEPGLTWSVSTGGRISSRPVTKKGYGLEGLEDVDGLWTVPVWGSEVECLYAP